MFLNQIKVTTALGLLALSLSFSTQATDVTLAWDPTSGTNVAGYNLYWGLTSEFYTSHMDVGLATSGTISNLTPGLIYYFAVTDYDANGLESPFSGEISFAVPLDSPAATLQPPDLTGSRPFVSGTGPVGYQYDVLSSSNLVSWTTIGSVTVDSTGSFQFVDPRGGGDTATFYRLRQTAP
jgi:hypothetical protein